MMSAPVIQMHEHVSTYAESDYGTDLMRGSLFTWGMEFVRFRVRSGSGKEEMHSFTTFTFVPEIPQEQLQALLSTL
jgi:hypothetical protein